ncbi:MAG: hypothetical protein WA981_03425 [Glaciecola sp.]
MSCDNKEPKNNNWFILFTVFISSSFGAGLSNWLFDSLKSDASIVLIDHGTMQHSRTKKNLQTFVVKNEGKVDGVVKAIKINGSKSIEKFYASHTITIEKLRNNQFEVVETLVCPAEKYCEISAPFVEQELTKFEIHDGKDWVELKI